MRVTLSGPAVRLDVQALRVLGSLSRATSTSGPASCRRRSRTTFRSAAATTTASSPSRISRRSSARSRCSRSAGCRRGISRRCAFRSCAGACSRSRSGPTAASPGRVAVINEYMATKFWPKRRRDRQAVQVRQRDRHVEPLDHGHRRRGRHQAQAAHVDAGLAGLHAVSPGRLEHVRRSSCARAASRRRRRARCLARSNRPIRWCRRIAC